MFEDLIYRGMGSALADLRIVDFSRVLAGPLATMVLADLGAEVTKVERPGTGDTTRTWGPPYDEAGTATYFAAVNRNAQAEQGRRRAQPADAAPMRVAQKEQGRERRSMPTSVIPPEVILIRVGTLSRSSNFTSTVSPLEAIPDRSGSSKASGLSDDAI